MSIEAIGSASGQEWRIIFGLRPDPEDGGPMPSAPNIPKWFTERFGQYQVGFSPGAAGMLHLGVTVSGPDFVEALVDAYDVARCGLHACEMGDEVQIGRTGNYTDPNTVSASRMPIRWNLDWYAGNR